MALGAVAAAWRVVLLAVAGVGAGVANGVAGGGTFITFPTLLALGVPALQANVSSTVGLVPSVLGGVGVFRAELREHRSTLRAAAPWCLAGSRDGDGAAAGQPGQRVPRGRAVAHRRRDGRLRPRAGDHAGAGRAHDRRRPAPRAAGPRGPGRRGLRRLLRRGAGHRPAGRAGPLPARGRSSPSRGCASRWGSLTNLLAAAGLRRARPPRGRGGGRSWPCRRSWAGGSARERCDVSRRPWCASSSSASASRRRCA